MQKMPLEPSVVSDVRLALVEEQDNLEMMPKTKFFSFLSEEALPRIKRRVGIHMLEVMKTITNVLHIQCEVSCRTCHLTRLFLCELSRLHRRMFVLTEFFKLSLLNKHKISAC